MGVCLRASGAFDLGFERAGFETIWQVEIDEYCRRVLERHFPGAERFRDIRDCGAHNLRRADVITGGFPCQDISQAGKRAGISGKNSGLWREFARIIHELRPNFAVVENVAALTFRGAEQVFGDLAALGFDAEWSVLSACSVGFPHPRERMFIVAYPALDGRMQRRRIELQENSAEKWNIHLWPSEPEPLRVAYGIPNRMDRKRAIGNSVVPQLTQWIAERIKRTLTPTGRIEGSP